MELVLRRRFDNGKATTGELYVNGNLFCVTLEDTFRREKISGETRIPSGRYEIKFRHGSPMANRYAEKYGTEGMVWLQNVPGYSWVYIHIGNDEDASEGCILVGSQLRQIIGNGEIDSTILNSTETYKKLHSLVKNEIELFITIIDE